MLLRYAIFGLLGLFAGAAGSTLIFQIYSDGSILRFSRCHHCKRFLPGFGLLPLGRSLRRISGACAQCEGHPFADTVFIEGGSLLLFLIAHSLYPTDSINTFFTGLALCILFFACTYDLLHQGIPRRMVALFALASSLNVLLTGDFVSSSFAAIIVMAILGGQLVLSRGRSISRDDVYIGTILAFWLGFKNSMIMLVGGYLIGSAVVIAFTCLTKGGLKQRVVIAPFLGIGAILALLLHGHVKIAYLS